MLPIALQIALTFLPQPQSRIEGLTQWAIVACSKSASLFSGGRIYQAAAPHIVPVPRGPAQEMLNQQAKGSGWRYVPAALKLAGLGLTSLQAAQVVKLNERRLQALAPAATTVLEAVDLLARDRRPIAELPEALVPPFVQLAEGACGEYVLFARPQQDAAAFRVELP